MAKRDWHVYIDGECKGPLATDAVTQMLNKNRVQFSDFAWTEGFPKWTRLAEIKDFQDQLPAYPSIPIPSSAKAPVAQAEEAEADEPEPAPKAKVVPIRPPKVEAPAPVAAKAAKASRGAAAVAAKAEPVEAEEAKPQEEAVPKKPGRRLWRVPIDATVTVEGFGNFKVLDISEGGLLLEAKVEIEVGTDFKVQISSPSFPKPLEMTALLVRNETSEDGTKCYGVEFTKANPAHKRALATYVTSKLKLDE